MKQKYNEESIKELLETSHFDVSQIDSIGIGAPGQVDREKGILISAPNPKNFTISFF